MKDLLSTKWYDTVQTIIMSNLRKKTIPEPKKPKMLGHFFDCIASQMTQSLQDIAVRSLKEFTKLMCDVSD